jgi:hypothetical protein
MTHGAGILKNVRGFLDRLGFALGIARAGFRQDRRIERVAPYERHPSIRSGGLSSDCCGVDRRNRHHCCHVHLSDGPRLRLVPCH